MTDHSFKEVIANAESLAKAGVQCYQKFTCEGCGQRLTIDEPNVFYTKGTCDACGHETDIEKNGCDFMAIYKGW